MRFVSESQLIRNEDFPPRVIAIFARNDRILATICGFIFLDFIKTRFISKF